MGWWLSQRPSVKPLGTDTIPAFVLLPIAPRANTPTNLVALPPNTLQFRLELALETVEPGLYRAVLLNAAGQELGQWSGLRPFEKARLYQIALDVPNGALPAGIYQIKLSVAANDGKLTDAEHYLFQITR